MFAKKKMSGVLFLPYGFYAFFYLLSPSYKYELVLLAQVPLFSGSELEISIGHQGRCFFSITTGQATREATGWELQGLPREIMKGTTYEIETSFGLMTKSVLLRSVLRKETKLTCKGAEDSWILCQLITAGVYL